MGFGIATLGYGFMLTYEAGGGIIAGLLLAYGFYLASKVNKRFIAASLSALFLIPHSILLLLDILNFIDLDSSSLLYSISYSVFLLAWLSISINYLTAVKQIAEENGSEKLQNKAMNRLYFTTVFLLAAFSPLIFRDIGVYGITAFLYVIQYIVIIVNILFLHTCFIMITTESQYEKDKKRLEKEKEKLLAKRKKK